MTPDARAALAPDVRAVLGTVRDPELDEPITDLGFVAAVRADPDGGVEVDLRLPTYFCAPNFAYLMVADARDAVAGLPGVRSVRVRLLDHFASDEINGGVAAGAGFAGSFPGLADDAEDAGLAKLRAVFRRKAHAAAQDVVVARLRSSGWSDAALAGADLGDVPDSAERSRLLRRRAELGLPACDDAPVLVDDAGRRLTVEELPLRLRLARTTRISIEGNAALCRGLLAVRYPSA